MEKVTITSWSPKQLQGYILYNKNYISCFEISKGGWENLVNKEKG